MAEAFPQSRFVGIDPHAASIAEAREHAAPAGVADRVPFVVGTARTTPTAGSTWSASSTACMTWATRSAPPGTRARPCGGRHGDARRAVRRRRRGGQRRADRPGVLRGIDDGLRAHALSEESARALGAQAGEARLARVFADAGFGHWRRAAETPFNLILEARA